MKPQIKEPSKQGIFRKPRKLATTNESTFTVYLTVQRYGKLLSGNKLIKKFNCPE